MRAQHYFEKAQQLYDAGDYRNAAEECDNALTFDPLFFDALRLRGMIYYERGAYRSSLEWLRKALQQSPDDRQLRLRLIDAALKSEKYVPVVRQTQYMLNEKPDDREAIFLYYCAHVKSRRDDWVGKAQVKIQELVDQQYDDPRIYCLFAELSILKGALADAENILMQHYTDHEIWHNTMLLLADSFIASGDFKKVIEVYSAVVERSDDKKPLQERLADLLIKARQYKFAASVLRDITKQYPDDMNQNINLINCLVALKEYDDAEQLINALETMHAEDFGLKKKKIDFLFQKGDLERALDAGKKILASLEKNSPAYVEIMNLVGDVYFVLGNYTEAQNCSREIIAIYPQDAHARFNLCRVKLQTSASLSLVGELRQLINENPNNAEYNYYLGLVHHKRNENVMAEKAFRDALQKDPGYKNALIGLAEIYIRQGSYNILETDIREYTKVKPEDNETMLLLEKMKKSNAGAS